MEQLTWANVAKLIVLFAGVIFASLAGLAWFVAFTAQYFT